MKRRQKYYTEAGKVLYFPGKLEPHAQAISAQFQAGMTTKELGDVYGVQRRFIVALLKSRGVFRYSRASKAAAVTTRGLIKHPSERWRHDDRSALPQPTPVHRDHCLRCQKPFVAEAKTIYICSPCKSSVDFNISGDYSMAVG